MSNSKLTRFTESFSPSATEFVRVPVTLELQEKYSLDAVSKKLREANISEELDGSQRAVYKFPISRFDHMNNNGRNYPKQLWENVINGQQNIWKNYVGLADHPEGDSDGEFKNAAVVWHDMEIDDLNKLIWAVASFVGPYGRLAQEIVDAGGRVGFSSSGLGELKHDGKTVNPETFQIERVADIVLNPSQNVFGDASNSLNIEYSRQEPVMTESIVKEPLEEKKMQEGTNKTPISRMEERKFARDIKSCLEDVDKISSPQERLNELTDILGYFESGAAPALREQVEARIKKEQLDLETLLKEAQTTRDEFGISSTEELKEGIALMAQESKVALSEAKQWEEVAVVLKEQNVKLVESIDKLKAKLNSRPTATKYGELKEALDQEKKAFRLKQREIRRELIERSRKLNDLTEEKTKLDEQLVIARKSIEALKEGTRTRIGKLKESVQSTETETKTLKESLVAKDNTIASLQDEVTFFKEALETEKTQVQEANEKADAIYSENQVLQEKLDSTTKDFIQFKENKDKIPMMPTYAERVSGHLNFRENGGVRVEKYWADLTDRYGNVIAPYERQIRGAKTYKEATQAFLKALPNLDPSADLARLPETASMTASERREKLEEAGMNFGQEKTMVDRMPKGFQ